MENKDVNIIFKLNTNVIIVSMVLFLLLGMIIFCACYNLPIFKRVREILKSELTKSDVEAFSVPSVQNMIDTPKYVLKDLNDIFIKKNGKQDSKPNSKPNSKDDKKENMSVQRKPVVEGFFTNIRPN